MDFQRMIMFGALALVLVMLWQAWLEHEGKRNAAAPTITATTSTTTTDHSGTSTTDDVPVAPTAPQAAPTSSQASSAVPTAEMLPTASRIVVETDLVRAEIDTYGGDLRQLELLTYPVEIGRAHV